MSSNNVGDKTAYYHNPSGKGTRVLIIGGSATVHPPDEELGFVGNFGLSASDEHNDYVHVMLRYCEFAAPQTSFLVVQSRLWEEDYLNEQLFNELFSPAREFCADVVVIFVGEHVCQQNFDAKLFERYYKKLVEFVKVKSNACVLLCTTLFRSPCDKVIQEFANKNKLPCIFMGSLMLKEGMLGRTRYKSAYLDSFPNDRGMREIAEGILCIIGPFLKEE